MIRFSSTTVSTTAFLARRESPSMQPSVWFVPLILALTVASGEVPITLSCSASICPRAVVASSVKPSARCDYLSAEW